MSDKNLQNMVKAVSRTDTPIEHRKTMMVEYLQNCDEDSLQGVFKRMSESDTQVGEETREMAKWIRDLVNNIQRAPMRPATFIELTRLDNSNSPHAMVISENGETGYMAVHDLPAVEKLKLGDRVAIDAKATILIDKADTQHQFGHEVRFERRLDSKHIEVTSRGDEKLVVLTSKAVMDKIEAGKVNPGDVVVIASGDKVAISYVPAPETHYYRFIDRGPIPDILVDRDIGSPPRVIDQVSQHVREEMTRPENRRRFRLRPCITRLLSGVSGSGKTLAVQAIHRRMYEIMSEVTKTPIEKLPQRVFRFKTSQILSMWLGESDKNADRLFDEVEKMAKQTYTNDDGKTFVLPVMVVMEEAEGMGRSRGDTHDSVYDRILSTLLQRLDPNRAGLAEQLVVFLSTTNEPHLVDPAFLRRIGGSVERFGRLDQLSFADVLKKLVRGLPAESSESKSQTKLWNEITGGLEEWLYTDETAVVELSLSGLGPMHKYRRDFLTGALIDRAVQESSNAAWQESLENPDAGISLDHLKEAIIGQVDSLVHQITPVNASHYLDIPEGSKVVKVRNLLAPSGQAVIAAE
jgi:ATP-dependent 26S proteasome regulatory subunit